MRRESEGTSFASYFGETNPTLGVSQGGHRKRKLFFFTSYFNFLVAGLSFKNIF